MVYENISYTMIVFNDMNCQNQDTLGNRTVLPYTKGVFATTAFKRRSRTAINISVSFLLNAVFT